MCRPRTMALELLRAKPMRRWCLALITTIGVAPAWADDPPPAAQPAPAAFAPSPRELATRDLNAMSDEELAALAEAEAEVIEIWDERPEKPFDRDTELRLTGEELAQRGATDLGTALALLPDVSVRDAGRGGWNVDIRGARKGA